MVRRGAGDDSAPKEKGVTWGPAATWPPQPITEHGQPREIDDPKVGGRHISEWALHTRAGRQCGNLRDSCRIFLKSLKAKALAVSRVV